MHLKPETAPTTVVCVIYIKIGKSEGGISIHRKTTRRQRLKESPEKNHQLQQLHVQSETAAIYYIYIF